MTVFIFKMDPLIRKDRCQFLKTCSGTGKLRIHTIDRNHTQQRTELLCRRFDLDISLDNISGSQRKTSDRRRRYINIILSRHIIITADKTKSAFAHNL